MPGEDVIARLNRYADALPLDEPIPIGREVERFEVVLWATQHVQTSRFEERDSMDAVLDLIDAGKFHFRGHRVVAV